MQYRKKFLLKIFVHVDANFNFPDDTDLKRELF